MNEKKSIGLAVASMVLGIVSLLLGCCFWYITLPAALIGVVLAAISLAKHHGGKGMAITGLVTSIISLVPAVIIMITGSSLMALGGISDNKPKDSSSVNSIVNELTDETNKTTVPKTTKEKDKPVVSTEPATEPVKNGVTYYPQNSEYMPTLDAWFQCYYNPSSGYDDPYIYIHPQSYIDGLKEYYPENYQLLVDSFNQTRKTISEVQTTTPTYTVVKETVLTESECSRTASEIMNDCNRTIKDYSLYHNDISVDDSIKVYDLVVEKGYEIEIEYTNYMGKHGTMTRWAVYIPNDGWKISYT